MKITSLQKYKGTTYEVELDDDRKIYLHIDIIVDFGLRTGMELDRSELRKIIYASNFRRAYQYALHLLDVRDYSRKEMFGKLVKTYKSEKLCSAVMDKLTELDFINDSRYAEKLARKYVEIRRFGARRASMEMYRKGVPKEVIEDALCIYDEKYAENLSELLTTSKYERLLTDRDDRKSVEKAKNSLVRLGYSFTEVNEAVRNYFDSVEDNIMQTENVQS
ncbi:MAG: RecX family transcriptional regulator [Oscillospiraceae bacterium]|nr:RecX family transcriptional regulator [Oscillospiraceae bacterium]